MVLLLTMTIPHIVLCTHAHPSVLREHLFFHFHFHVHHHHTGIQEKNVFSKHLMNNILSYLL